MKIEIQQGRLLSPGNGLDQPGSLYIADGSIIGIGDPAPGGFDADLRIDASGMIVCPGLVDLCARLQDAAPEQEVPGADVFHIGAMAGVTSICCPPDVRPCIDSPAAVELISHRAAGAGKVRVYLLGALTQQLAGEMLSSMDTLKQAGCLGVSNALRPIIDSNVLRRAMEYASGCDMTVFLSCEDPFLRGNGVMHEGEACTRAGLPPIPETAETVALARALLLAEQTGVRLHVCRLTTARAAELLQDARARGLPVTADVSVLHLFLADSELDFFDPSYHLSPPIRGTRDRARLRAAVAEGIIDCICSDHRPPGLREQSAPLFSMERQKATLELLLPLALRLVQEGVLTLSQALALLTHRSADILRVKQGRLQVGAGADVCIFDPDADWPSGPMSAMGSTRRYPSFVGEQPLKGRVKYTLLRGELVYRHG